MFQLLFSIESIEHDHICHYLHIRVRVTLGLGWAAWDIFKIKINIAVRTLNEIIILIINNFI